MSKLAPGVFVVVTRGPAEGRKGTIKRKAERPLLGFDAWVVNLIGFRGAIVIPGTDLKPVDEKEAPS